MSWKEHEENVRSAASLIWNGHPIASKESGIDFDCIIDPEPGKKIIIEATKRTDLDKLRGDINRLSTARHNLFINDNIFTTCYFVTPKEPSNDLRETGKSSNVNVISLAELKGKFLDFRKYCCIRKQRPFGSAVNPVDGKEDTIDYIPVKYEDSITGQDIPIKEIKKRLYSGRNIIITGEYGSGKSRAIKELFEHIAQDADDKSIYPISIDLKEQWGVKRAAEMIRRHMDDLGLSEYADNIIRSLGQNSLIFLLDGFDEIGAQSWSDNKDRLKEIRKAALTCVANLSELTNSGLLITGREHYFDSHEEMISCLGLNSKDTDIIRCRDEFSIPEMEKFLQIIDYKGDFPEWLPRRPLICRTILSLAEDESGLLESENSVAFWSKLIDVICEREVRIRKTLDAESLKSIYRELARLTRSKPADVGPITMSEMNTVFEKVTGMGSGDESALLLQRLPGLGRINAESLDRRFVDIFILDGLRAVDVEKSLIDNDQQVLKEKWINPLRQLGCAVLSRNLSGFDSILPSYINKSNDYGNHVLVSDLLSSICFLDSGSYDCKNINIGDGHFHYLKLGGISNIENIYIHDAIIDTLEITPGSPNNILIEKCLINRVLGISSERGMPTWAQNDNEIDQFTRIDNNTRIRESNLNEYQQVLCSIFRKTFLQPGRGRQERALMRGFERVEKKVRKIVSILLSEDYLEWIHGDDGKVYKPRRNKRPQVEKMLSELNLSQDPLWLKVSELKD